MKKDIAHVMVASFILFILLLAGAVAQEGFEVVSVIGGIGALVLHLCLFKLDV